MNQQHKIILTILLLSFTIGSVLLIMIGLYYLSRYFASKHWPFVEGEIINSNITEGRDSDGIRSYTPSILYEYKLNGKTYCSKRINIIFEYSSSELIRANRIKSQYRIGYKVKVYYNPLNPNYSILEQDVRKEINIILAIGIIILVGIFGSVIFMSIST